MRRLFLLLVVWAFMSGGASAQTFMFQFTASPDHDVVNATNGENVVTGYRVDIANLSDVTTVLASDDIGKPTPDAQNRIRTDITGLLEGLAPPTRLRVAIAVAVGPGGEGSSGRSDNAVNAPSVQPTPAPRPPSDATIVVAGTPPPPGPVARLGWGSRVLEGCPPLTDVHVTTRNDGPTGGVSFRTAVSGDNRRVLFDVAGDLQVSSDLPISSDCLHIDGASAPSPGVTLKHGSNPIGFNNAHDLLVNDIRVDGDHTFNSDQGASVPMHQFRFHGTNECVRNVYFKNVTFTESGDGALEAWACVENLTAERVLFYRIDYASGGPGYGGRMWTYYLTGWLYNRLRQPFIGGPSDRIDIINNATWAPGCPPLDPFSQGVQIRGGTSSEASQIRNIRLRHNWFRTRPGCGSSPNSAIHHPGGVHPSTTLEAAVNDYPAGETDDVNLGVVQPTEAWARVPVEFTSTQAMCQAMFVDGYIGTRFPTQQEQTDIAEMRATMGC